MSSRITFAPPPWVTALLLRSPTPAPPQPRAPPSAMRHLVAQWLVYVTDDVTTPIRHPPHVIARFRGWLAALVFHIPAFVRRPPPPPPDEAPMLQTAQFSLIQRSLYFSSSIRRDASDNAPTPPPRNAQSKQKNNTPSVVEPRVRDIQHVKLSPLYKSLYFSSVAGAGQSDCMPRRCDSPLSSQDMRDGQCVQSFFLTDDNGEGKGILEGLKEIKAQSAEPQRKRGWVPAVVSLILIALNPLKG